MHRVVIVGAGLAGLSALRALRDQGYDGAVDVVGAEPHPPYDRPPLSKGFLTGATGDDAVALDSPEGLDALDARWWLGRSAADLDACGAAVVLEDGTSLPADGVVVATGSRARRLGELDGVARVHVLRTLDDARLLREDLVRGGRLLVLGGGFVGAEVAAAAVALGTEVTIVEAEPVLMGRQFGTDLAPVWLRLHRRHGVTVRTGTAAVRWLVDGERVRGAVLADDSRVAADMVLVAIGSEPAVGWITGSGLALDGGLVCDSLGRTALPQVVGAGDVVRAPHAFVGGPVRIEHWTHALQQPALAVAALLGGAPEPPRTPPYVWSDQYDARIQFAGHHLPGDTMTVVAGDVAGRQFTALFERSRRPVAALSVSQPREFGRWKRVLVPAADVAAADAGAA